MKTRQIQQGDSIPGFCCSGFDWDVSVIFPDKNEGDDSIWGSCQNPDCLKYQEDIGPGDIFRGISSILREDLDEWQDAHQLGAALLAML